MNMRKYTSNAKESLSTRPRLLLLRLEARRVGVKRGYLILDLMRVVSKMRLRKSKHSVIWIMDSWLTISREAQTWGAGKSIISDRDRKDLKKARKEGKLAEAMLDRRAALKR
jgi:hypothetical protein